MDFDEAIRAHAAWKLRLAAYLRNPDGSIDHRQLCQDNRCALGRWIHGDGVAFRHLPEFTTLRDQHAAFHAAAGDIVRRADAGENISADVALSASSNFSLASRDVVSSIMKMKRLSAD